MKSSKILSLLTIMFALTIFSYMGNVKAYTSKDMQVRDLKKGDVIYFDNSQTNWDHVYIYIWDDESSNNNWYKPWDDATEMTKVEGTENIYEFKVPDDMEENKYENVIFKNGQKNNENQTIDLGFVESGYAYTIDNDIKTNDGKKMGYWYLYEKDTILSYLEDVEAYVKDKEYYTTESYGNLDELILEAATKAGVEIRLESRKDNDGHDNGHYYIEIDDKIKKIDEAIEKLDVDESLLEERIKDIEEQLDKNKDKYTDESLKELESTLENAKKLLEEKGNEITVDQLKEYLENIDEASNNLEEKIIENNTNTSDKDTASKSEGNITTDTNPKTYDSITLYIVIGIISLGLVGFTVKKFLFR